jgi:hypothetical protein
MTFYRNISVALVDNSGCCIINQLEESEAITIPAACFCAE